MYSYLIHTCILLYFDQLTITITIILHYLGGKGSHEEVHRLWALGPQLQDRWWWWKRGRCYLWGGETGAGRNQEGMTNVDLICCLCKCTYPLYCNSTMCMTSLPIKERWNNFSKIFSRDLGLAFTEVHNYIASVTPAWKINCCLCLGL